MELLQGADGSASWALAAAAAAGFSASFHCFAMCGPLACAAAPAGIARARDVALFHAARVCAYAAAGGLLGAIGAGLAGFLTVRLAPILPWLMVATLLANALGLQRFLPAPGAAPRIVRLGLRGTHFLRRAPLLGALTPLLPCALLYGMFAAAIATSSFAGGALLAGAFSLGAIPALLAAQLSAHRLLQSGGKLSLALRRFVPATAAVVLAWRALAVHAGHACH